VGPEAATERRSCALVKFYKGLAIKLANPFMRNLPDRLMLLPGAVILFVEFKAPGKKPNEGQREMHERIRKLGFTVLVIDDYGWFQSRLKLYVEA